MQLISLGFVMKPGTISILPRRLYSSFTRRNTKKGSTDFTSREHVLHRDIQNILKQKGITSAQVRLPETIIEKFLFAKNDLNVLTTVKVLTSSAEGEGLALIKRMSYDVNCTDPEAYTVLTVPKTVKGDVIEVKLRRHYNFYAEGELVSIIKPSRTRDQSRVLCKHFDNCNGCQFQMLRYDSQIVFKENLIKSAYLYFYPALDTSRIENFGQVVELPSHYSYRTKLTPHAPKFVREGESIASTPMGFDDVRPGKPVVDVQHCPIAVPSINDALPNLKQLFLETLANVPQKKLNTTFILRDSFRVNHKSGEYTNVALDDKKSVITELVNDKVFQFQANDFFQNNRSILPIFLDFLSHLLSDISFQHIVDAYCGCGFLGLSLSLLLPDDGKVYGIEISKNLIKYAEHNAKLNGLGEKAEFVHGNSDAMFTHENFTKAGPDSVLLMNPSRKGSTEEFMKQILEFKPKAVIYVSCNVFTQARDLAFFDKEMKRCGIEYNLKSVTGFDFYPQTKHVELVAVLHLKP